MKNPQNSPYDIYAELCDVVITLQTLAEQADSESEETDDKYYQLADILFDATEKLEEARKIASSILDDIENE